MRVADFDYNLPPELIAQEPVEPRDASRLLVLHRENGAIEHRHFHDVAGYLRPGDALVLNETRVLPARLFGRRIDSGGQVEILLLREVATDRWQALARPARRVRRGGALVFGQGELSALVREELPDGQRVLELEHSEPLPELLQRLGELPLPPYIHSRPADRERYQTIYARTEGSAAAPTAGLHFTPQLLSGLSDRGVQVIKVLLHVGLDTFRPVRVERVEEHLMHSEFYQLEEEAAAALNQCRAAGGRVVAVGTTSVRTLESCAGETGHFQPGSGWTDIFIYPGYHFRGVDALITNFHLPRSTLLMLVSAFAGQERIQQAYREAIDLHYRFFSFGDAMLII